MAGRARHVIAGRRGVHVDEDEILKGRRCVGSGVIVMLCRKIERRIYFTSLFGRALLAVLQALKSVHFGLHAVRHFCP